MCISENLSKQRIADLKKRIRYSSFSLYAWDVVVGRNDLREPYVHHPTRERRRTMTAGKERLWKRLSNIQNVASQKKLFLKSVVACHTVRTFLLQPLFVVCTYCVVWRLCNKYENLSIAFPREKEQSFLWYDWKAPSFCLLTYKATSSIDPNRTVFYVKGNPSSYFSFQSNWPRFVLPFLLKVQLERWMAPLFSKRANVYSSILVVHFLRLLENSASTLGALAVTVILERQLVEVNATIKLVFG